MNIDKLNHAEPRQVLQVAYHLLDTLQNHPAHLSVAALGMLIRETSDLLRIPVSELLNKSDRMTGDLNTHYTPEIRALREYIRQEMREKHL